jgi:hypothetical protein
VLAILGAISYFASSETNMYAQISSAVTTATR